MYELSEDQDLALGKIIQFLGDATQKEMVLAGPAGTGKTYLTRHILTAARGTSHRMLRLLLGTKKKLDTELTSTTNKAATVLSNSTGENVRTIHSLLGLRPMKDYTTGETKMVPTNNTKMLEHLFLIVDEASMINDHLLNTIRKQTMKCKILYILDEYQLAPVKASSIPVIETITNQVRLTTIQRQAKDSAIITCAAGFRNALDTGIFPQIMSFGSDVQHVSKPEFKQVIDEAFIKEQTDESYKIMAWANKRVHQYNNYIRKLKNLPPFFKLDERVLVNSAITYGDTVLHRTDSIVKVTYMMPGMEQGISGWNIELNGSSMHFIAENPSKVHALKSALKKAKEWKKFYEVEETFADLRPLYAGTVTKSQGSTYHTTFIDVADIGRNTKNKEIARLMYTAITRASNKVYLCGELPARLYR